MLKDKTDVLKVFLLLVREPGIVRDQYLLEIELFSHRPVLEDID